MLRSSTWMLMVAMAMLLVLEPTRAAGQGPQKKAADDDFQWRRLAPANPYVEFAKHMVFAAPLPLHWRIFLLPGRSDQGGFSNEWRGGKLELFDNSGDRKDPKPVEEPKKVPSRQDSILKYFTDPTLPAQPFLKPQKPVEAYRFGVDDADFSKLFFDPQENFAKQLYPLAWPAQPILKQLDGRGISTDEFARLKTSRLLAEAYMRRVLQQSLETAEKSLANDRTKTELEKVIKNLREQLKHPQIFDGGTKLGDLVEFRLWLNEADRLRIKLTDEFVTELVRLRSREQLDGKALQAIAQGIGKDHQNASAQAITAALRDEFCVQIARQAIAQAAAEFEKMVTGKVEQPEAKGTDPRKPISIDDIWKFYKKQRAEADVTLLPVDVEKFLKGIKEPSQQEQEAFFENNKEVPAQPALQGFVIPRSKQEVARLQTNRKLAEAYMRRVLQQALEAAEKTPANEKTIKDLREQLKRPQIFGGGTEAKDLFEFATWLDEADRLGITLTNDDVVNLVQSSHKSLDRQTLLVIAQSVGKEHKNATPHAIADALKDEFRVVAAKRESLIRSLREGTNIGGAKLELVPPSNFIQQIILISDGQSNSSSDQARAEFLRRVNHAGRTIPVVTIGTSPEPEILQLRREIIELKRRLSELESKVKSK